MHEITPNEILRVFEHALHSPESVQLETKRVSGKMVGKALETICAFANTNGGWLVLGMDDFSKSQGNDRIYGIGENQEAVDELIRKISTHFLPSIDNVSVHRHPCCLRDNREGFVLLVRVPASDKVHSILDDGTWMRGIASNREMTASEISDLAYRRGTRSAESEPLDIDFDLLNTDTWTLFLRGRGLAKGDIKDQLFRLGLAKKVGHEIMPTRAAVLLFAMEPGALLAGFGTRADVRVFHYSGNSIEDKEVPNLKKAPKTISGPIYNQISQTYAYILDEIAAGLTLAASGFKTVHRYPERVIKEAITNAIIHRDYRINRDIQIRIFDSRIEVVSPGAFPGRITPTNISKAGSFARNPLIARNLREFPEPPNVDAGEGVRIMFSLMKDSNLFPPQYLEAREREQESVTVTLLNEERPAIWEQVSAWVEEHGSIANSDLCQIAGMDTLKASKTLKRWVEQGILVPVEGRSKRNMLYEKPTRADLSSDASLFSLSTDNKS